MYLEWPDLEAQQKRKAKAKRQKKKDFIASNSDDDSGDRKRGSLASSVAPIGGAWQGTSIQ